MKSRAIAAGLASYDDSVIAAAEQRTCDFRLLGKELVAGLLLRRVWACKAETSGVNWGVCGIKRGV